MGGYRPVFTSEQLITGESCEVEIIDCVYGDFMIGVTTSELRNRAHQYENNDSMCILSNGTLISDSKR
jgi:hypothetical protein